MIDPYEVLRSVEGVSTRYGDKIVWRCPVCHIDQVDGVARHNKSCKLYLCLQQSGVDENLQRVTKKARPLHANNIDMAIKSGERLLNDLVKRIEALENKLEVEA